MEWPQVTYIVLSALTGISYAAMHGKPRGNYNYFDWVISAAVTYWLLIFGGFFK